MVVVIGDEGIESVRAVANEWAHSEVEVYYWGIYYKLTHLWNVYGGGLDAGIEKVHAVVGLGL